MFSSLFEITHGLCEKIYRFLIFIEIKHNSNGFIIYFQNNYHCHGGDYNIAESYDIPVVPRNEKYFFWLDRLPPEKKKNIRIKILLRIICFLLKHFSIIVNLKKTILAFPGLLGVIRIPFQYCEKSFNYN